MILTPQRLQELGQTLYGLSWEGTMAAKLNYTRRTVNNWKAGKPMPVGLRKTLLTLIDEQIEALYEKRKEINPLAPGKSVSDFGK